MVELKFRVLDAESVQDPETLLDILGDLLNTQRILINTLGMCAAMTLHALGEVHPPSDGVYTDTVTTLREYMAAARLYGTEARLADQFGDLLEARE